MKTLSSLLLLLFCAYTIVSHGNPQPAAANDDSNLLNFAFIKQPGFATPGSRGFVVQREAIALKEIKDRLSFDMLKRRHPKKEYSEAFADFSRRNAAVGTAPNLNLTIPLTVATRSEIGIYRKGFTWTAFYKRHPRTDGLLSFALPGYSSDRNTALVYIVRRSGGRAGTGELILMLKQDGTWSVKEVVTGWQS